MFCLCSAYVLFMFALCSVCVLFALNTFKALKTQIKVSNCCFKALELVDAKQTQKKHKHTKRTHKPNINKTYAEHNMFALRLLCVCFAFALRLLGVLSLARVMCATVWVYLGPGKNHFER